MNIWNYINDHVNKENHVIDWNRDNVLAKEPVHKLKYLIGEEMYIRQILERTTMNRGQGNYQPCNINYNNLIPEGTVPVLWIEQSDEICSC